MTGQGTKAVAYVCPFVPAEWIAAHGFRPMRLLPGRSARRGAARPPAGMCPYASAFLNDLRGEAGWQAAVFTTVCDQMRRAAEWFSRETDRPVFLLNVPATWQTPSAVRLYADELKRLGRFLVGLGGRAPAREELVDAMLASDSARGQLRAARGRLGGRAFAEAAAEFHRTGRLPPPDGGEAIAPGGIAVAVVGGPMLGEHLALFDLVEEFGGRIVLDATANGDMTLPAPFDRRRLRAEPMSELIEAYFGAIPHAMRRPNSALYRWLKAALADTGARGVLFQRQVWCDLWHAEAARIREWTPLPVLDVVIGDEDACLARLAGKVQAFLEMLR